MKADIEKYMTLIDGESETCIGENDSSDCHRTADSVEDYTARHASVHFAISEVQRDCLSNSSDETTFEPEWSSSSPTWDSDNGFFPDSIEQQSVSSESEATSSEDEYESLSDLQNMLAGWAGQYVISQAAVGSLLKILRMWFLASPKDPRTLKQRSKQEVIPIKELAGGNYCHIGLEKGIRNQLSRDGVVGVKGGSRTVSLQINTDGLPLYKSSSAQFWPILGLIQNYSVFFTKTRSDPFVIGLYHGNSKPSDVNEVFV